MNNGKVLGATVALLLSLAGCGEVPSSSNSSNNKNSEIPSTKEEYVTLVENFEQIDVEVDETFNLSYAIKANSGITVSLNDEGVASLESNIITGKQVGETSIELNLEGKKQLVNVNVHEKGALGETFSFELGRLANKKIVAFGDSVTANATIGGENTYYNNFANKFRMQDIKNYAIGGTTATYMYEGSNIYKEYAGNETAIDGVRVVKKAYDKGELNGVDYAFIAYGHNDQYFQPPITVSGDDVYDVNSFDSCHSFKGSYRYMINTLKLANPNIRIMLLNCTYSEYDKTLPSRYGKTYSYADYRTAIEELAAEFSLTHIDPWQHLEIYFDAYDTKYYYKDSVHLSVEGHKILTQYIINSR